MRSVIEAQGSDILLKMPGLENSPFNTLIQACRLHVARKSNLRGMQNIFSCNSKKKTNKFISLETCQEDTPIFPVPLKCGQSPPHTCIVTFCSAQIPTS
jgi:hypothetical protein